MKFARSWKLFHMITIKYILQGEELGNYISSFTKGLSFIVHCPEGHPYCIYLIILKQSARTTISVGLQLEEKRNGADVAICRINPS